MALPSCQQQNYGNKRTLLFVSFPLKTKLIQNQNHSSSNQNANLSFFVPWSEIQKMHLGFYHPYELNSTTNCLVKQPTSSLKWIKQQLQY